ncbi:MAG: shikimate dehydrogenase [Oscillospiraceae bacterium]|nr:shikimate dehydrogenase [Oscillospiraceae bacterium]
MSALQVIGDPVLHSLSPVIHGAMLKRLGLDIPYTAHVVKRGELGEYFAWAEKNGVTGFNATMPHKQDLIPLLDEVDGDAALFGAVNTVVMRNGRKIGYNTDGVGCLAALEEAGMWPAERVVLLGAGGAARAVALKLAGSGAKTVYVCNRTVEKAEELCEADPNGVLKSAGFAPEALAGLCGSADVLINCTNLGMAGCEQFEDLGFLEALPSHAGMFDLIYHPEKTELLSRGERLGHRVCNGLPMLIHQAIFALEYFLDRPLDHGEMGEAVRDALKNR